MKTKQIFQKISYFLVALAALAVFATMLPKSVTAGPAWTPTPGPLTQRCLTMGIKTQQQCDLMMQQINIQARSTATPVPWSWAPPSTWKCPNHVWTSMWFEESWMDYHGVSIWLQSKGWAPFQRVNTPYNNPANWPGDIDSLAGPGDLIYLRVWSGTYDYGFTPTQITQLRNFANRGGTLVLEGEWTGFSEPSNINNVFAGLGVNLRMDPSIEVVESTKVVPPWNYPSWIFHMPSLNLSVDGAVALATGRFLDQGNSGQVVGIYRSFENDITAAEQPTTNGRIRGDGDSNGDDDLAYDYYGHYNNDVLRFTAAIMSCVNQAGSPIPTYPTPTPTLTPTVTQTRTPTATRPTPTPTVATATPTQRVCGQGGGGCITATPSVTPTPGPMNFHLFLPIVDRACEWYFVRAEWIEQVPPGQEGKEFFSKSVTITASGIFYLAGSPTGAKIYVDDALTAVSMQRGLLVDWLFSGQGHPAEYYPLLLGYLAHGDTITITLRDVYAVLRGSKDIYLTSCYNN